MEVWHFQGGLWFYYINSRKICTPPSPQEIGMFRVWYSEIKNKCRENKTDVQQILWEKEGYLRAQSFTLSSVQKEQLDRVRGALSLSFISRNDVTFGCLIY